MANSDEQNPAEQAAENAAESVARQEEAKAEIAENSAAAISVAVAETATELARETAALAEVKAAVATTEAELAIKEESDKWTEVSNRVAQVESLLQSSLTTENRTQEQIASLAAGLQSMKEAMELLIPPQSSQETQEVKNLQNGEGVDLEKTAETLEEEAAAAIMQAKRKLKRWI